MAQIIDFQFARAARPSRAATAPGNAEILFFLGVRYERMPDAPQAPSFAEAPKRGVKRARKRRA